VGSESVNMALLSQLYACRTSFRTQVSLHDDNLGLEGVIDNRGSAGRRDRLILSPLPPLTIGRRR
jgi:hypothetical protein